MTSSINTSEAFVSSLCARSFLKLWTHPNPRGKKGKELCDCLVVCGDDVIIISVKEIGFKDTGDATGWKRWIKTAIEKSVAQIDGAERFLETVEEIERHDGRAVQLPKKEKRRYHRIAVALGGAGQVPLKWGDLGNGFVHVCDEKSVAVLFSVLDTISDFVKFLTESEDLVKTGAKLIFDGGGLEDLLALYWSNGQTFQSGKYLNQKFSLIVLSDDLWEEVFTSKEFQTSLTERRTSYSWDRLIEHLTEDLLTDGFVDFHNRKVTRNELALVEMVLQPRAYRLELAKRLIEFITKPDLNIACRVAQGAAETAFVFLLGSSSDREYRTYELHLRCLVVRGRFPGVKTVVGIATDGSNSTSGYSFDIEYLFLPEWTVNREEQVVGIQRDLGYFKDAQWTYRK